MNDTCKNVDKEFILDEIDRLYNNMTVAELRIVLSGLKLDREKQGLIDEIVKFKYNVELSELYTDFLV